MWVVCAPIQADLKSEAGMLPCADLLMLLMLLLLHLMMDETRRIKERNALHGHYLQRHARHVSRTVIP